MPKLTQWFTHSYTHTYSYSGSHLEKWRAQYRAQRQWDWTGEARWNEGKKYSTPMVILLFLKLSDSFYVLKWSWIIIKLSKDHHYRVPLTVEEPEECHPHGQAWRRVINVFLQPDQNWRSWSCTWHHEFPETPSEAIFKEERDAFCWHLQVKQSLAKKKILERPGVHRSHQTSLSLRFWHVTNEQRFQSRGTQILYQ